MECQVKGITIHYEEHGAGRPFFGLHGWPLDHRHMVHEYEPLFERRQNWRRIYPDFPGMGQTPAAEWITCQDQMLEILLEFIDTVAPDERFTVAGTSYGGYMARGVVHHCGQRMDGMMINVPAVEVDEAKKRVPAHRLIHEDPAFLAALKPGEWVVEMLAAQSVEALDSQRTYYDPAVAGADHAFLDKLHERYAFSFPVDRLPQPFDAPALILTGRFDYWCGYKDAFDLLDQYPRASYAALDRASHALVMEESGLFLALANEWLDRVEEYVREEGNASMS